MVVAINGLKCFLHGTLIVSINCLFIERFSNRFDIQLQLIYDRRAKCREYFLTKVSDDSKLFHGEDLFNVKVEFARNISF